MRKIFTLVCLLWSVFLSAQIDPTTLAYANNQLEKGRQLRKAANYSEALLLCDSALLVFTKDTLSYDTLRAATYVEMALVYRALQRYEDSKKMITKSIAIYENAFGFYNKVLVKPFNVIGGNYFKQGNTNMALYFYNKALMVMDSVATADDDFWPVLYTNLGSFYFSNYDLENASLFHERALEADKEKYEAENINLLIDHFNLGTTFMKDAHYEEALLHYEEALSVFQLNGTLDSFYWAMIQCNIGDSYYDMKQVDEAYTIYENALRPLQTREGYHAFKSRVCRAKGKCLNEKKDFEKAIFYFDQSLDFAKSHGGNTIDIVYDCYQYLAKTYGEMGETSEALAFIDSSFVAVGFDAKHPKFWDSKINKVTLMDAVAIKAKLLLEAYQNNGHDADLRLAQESSTLGLAIVDSIKLDLKEKGSQQFVTEQFYPVYENAIAIDYELFLQSGEVKHINHAFQQFEKCKSNLLLDAVLKTKVRNYAKLPKSILDKELTLKSDIANTERQLYTLTNEGLETEENKIGELTGQLFDLKMEMQDLIAVLELNYEPYYNLKYKTKASDLEHVQNNLLDSTSTILEYFVGDDYCYALLITEDTVQLERLGLVKEMEPLIKQYCQMLSAYRPHLVNMEAHCETLADLSFILYNKLLAPFSERLKENIIIIPDGILSYLSFDALVKSKPEKPWEINQYDFITRHHSISYEHSVELMLENKTKEKRAPRNELLAIAPSFETNYQSEFLRSDELAPLLYNIKEAEAILAFCGGTLLDGSSANRQEFVSMASDYRAIHFATHGKANDRNGAYSYLAFSQNDQNSGDGNILFAQDIYNLELDADLVVLSACETGIGEWSRGEGMISMARAFSYAGAKNILTTLWKVNDSKAGVLMRNYYKNLQKGLGKSKALQQAKLDYLADSRLDDSHPFFWASFISIGNDEPMVLDKPSNSWIWWGVVGGLLFFYWGLCYLKRYRQE